MSTSSGRAQAQKKVRRQKQFVAVGSVVLLAILGFEMTKVLPHSDGQSAAPPVTSAITSSSAVAPAPSSGWNLPDTGRVVVQRNADQLISFGLFGSKDPFVQQLAVAATPAAAARAAPATVAPAATPASPTAVKPSKPLGVGLTPVPNTTPAPSTPANPSTSVPTAPALPTTTTSQTTPIAPEATPPAVLISTNGVCEKVALKGTFPSGEDIFRLVVIATNGKSVEIGVAGGSYDSGQATVTLKLEQKLTLVNTSDGTQYVIQFKSKCDVVRPARADGGSAAATPPPPSPLPPVPTTTTTSTTTTPIVPDSLDTTTTPTG
jgi:hypothetical protein